MRITYNDLKTKSYSQLKKMGATDNQLLTTVSKFYLKENRQLIVNDREGKTLSTAIKELKKGRVRQGVLLTKTSMTQTKNNIKNLNKLTKVLGKDSFANTLLTRFKRGESHANQINQAVHKYVNNIQQYESNLINVQEDFFKSSQLELIVDGYNK